MILGIGVDIVDVGRIVGAIERYEHRFVRRIFTPAEAAYCRRSAHPGERFATRFAAKEAAMKALGTGWQCGVRFLDVEVSNNAAGAPSITLHGEAAAHAERMGVERIHVSLSHHRDYAVAQVLFEGENSGNGG
jgi:holo-[acyl-carrier protein] synthase